MRYNRNDIILELSDLCLQIISEIEQNLVYYKASVYKNETHRHIHNRVEKLRRVARITGDFGLQDAFDDFDAYQDVNPATLQPGECLFSSGCTMLTIEFKKRCEELQNLAGLRQLDHLPDNFDRNVQRCRKDLLSMCRQGTRYWAFFQSL